MVLDVMNKKVTTLLDEKLTRPVDVFPRPIPGTSGLSMIEAKFLSFLAVSTAGFFNKCLPSFRKFEETRRNVCKLKVLALEHHIIKCLSRMSSWLPKVCKY